MRPSWSMRLFRVHGGDAMIDVHRKMLRACATALLASLVALVVSGLVLIVLLVTR